VAKLLGFIKGKSAIQIARNIVGRKIFFGPVFLCTWLSRIHNWQRKRKQIVGSTIWLFLMS